MTYGEIEKDWNKDLGVSFEDFLHIARAISKVYPMIVLANLTQNTYTMIRDQGFLYNEMAVSGCYDDLIDDNMDNIHSNYQKLFFDCFARENLLRSFKEGKNEVYVELYQKNKQGKYHWVSAHVIKIENRAGDVIHICLNRVLDGINEKRYGKLR